LKCVPYKDDVTTSFLEKEILQSWGWECSSVAECVFSMDPPPPLQLEKRKGGKEES
jgi:hypothetical protein